MSAAIMQLKKKKSGLFELKHFPAASSTPCGGLGSAGKDVELLLAGDMGWMRKGRCLESLCQAPKSLP